MPFRRFDPSRHAFRLESPRRHLRQTPELILPYLPPTDGFPVVEVGCGTGFFGRAVARYHRHSLYLGLDPSADMIRAFAGSLEPATRAPAFLALSPRESLPLRSGSVALLVMANVLHELLADRGILPEIDRVVAREGSIFLVDWKKRPTRAGPPCFLKVSRARALRLFRKLGFRAAAFPPVYRNHYCIRLVRAPGGRP